MSYGYFGAVNLLGGNSNAFTDGLPLDITDPLVLQSVPTSSVIISGTDGTLSGVNYGSGSSANSIVQRDVNGNIIINKANMLSLTAGMVLVSDSSKNVISSSVSATTLSYLDATSSIQTQLNGKLALSSGLIPQNFIVATGSNTIGTTGLMITSGSNIQINTELQIVPSSSGSALAVFKYPTLQTILSVDATSGTLTSSQLNGSNLTASTVLVADSSKNIISSGVSSTTLGYLDATSSIQTQLNSKQSTLSGLTSGKHLVANGSNSITTSSILGESGGNLQVGSNITFTSNTFNSGSTLLCPSTTYSGSFYAPSALNNVFVGNNGTNNYFNVNGGTGASILQLLQSGTSTNKALLFTGTGTGSGSPSSTTAGVYASLNWNSSGNRQLVFGDTDYTGTSGGCIRFVFTSGQPVIDNCTPDGSSSGASRSIIIATSLVANGGPNLGSSSGSFATTYTNSLVLNGSVLYNSSNSSAGTGYPTMDSLYTYEYTVTATNISASYSPVGGFIPFPSGKSGSNIRKLEVYMYDGTYFVPPVFGTVGSTYAYAIACSPSGIFIQTGSTWTQTTGTKTFYVWITTN